MNNDVEQSDCEKSTNICISVCLGINIFMWLTNISLTTSVYYDNFCTYSLQNYTGYNSYYIPPWWIIILIGLIQLYMIGYNLWLVGAQFSSKQYIKLSVRKIASLMLFHNLLRTVEYIIYSINLNETKNTNNTYGTIVGILGNYSQDFSILVVLFSAIILGIDIGMMAKLRTFYYDDSKLKNCLFDIPISFLFSWSVIDFIIQLNNILNASNWGYNENTEIYYGFMICISLIFFIVLLSFRNICTYLFYIILLIGYCTKFYEYDPNVDTDTYEVSTITDVAIVINVVTFFGYSIHYLNMYSSYKKRVKNDQNKQHTLEYFLNEPQIGGPLDELA